jgi:hypothetical protein
LVVDGRRTPAESPIIKLVWWISNDYVEFHFENLLWIFRVDELVRMGFEFLVALVIFLAGSAERAVALPPGVLHAIKSDISLLVAESAADGIFAIGGFGAIDGSAREQPGQFGDGETEKLFGENVVEAFLLVGDGFFKAFVEAFGDFAEKDAGFADGVEEGGLGIGSDFWGQKVEDAIGHGGWREDLIAAEVSEAGEDVGVVTIALEHRRA